jgi:PAH dioxygenase small subunit
MSFAAPIDGAIADEVRDFLFLEAGLLDRGRLPEWLGLLTDDMRYAVPLMVTRERTAGTGRVSAIAHWDDDRTGLDAGRDRVRLGRGPPSRSRQFATNIRVTAGESDGELCVRSNLLFFRSRGTKTASTCCSASVPTCCAERTTVLASCGERSFSTIRRCRSTAFRFL